MDGEAKPIFILQAWAVLKRDVKEWRQEIEVRLMIDGGECQDGACSHHSLALKSFWGPESKPERIKIDAQRMRVVVILSLVNF